MNLLRILLIFAISTACIAAEYTRDIASALNAVRKEIWEDGTPLLQGYCAGYPGRVGAFMRYHPIINGVATQSDVILMLRDSSPVVRLLGARLALDRNIRNDDFSALSHDDALVTVGPLYRGGQMFKCMKVSEVMVELRNDPLFELRMQPGCVVRIEAVMELSASDGTVFAFGRLPEYPPDLARAGLDGEVTAILRFSGTSRQPLVSVSKSSQREFEEPTIWALSKWELLSVAKDIELKERVFECHVVFRCEE